MADLGFDFRQRQRKRRRKKRRTTYSFENMYRGFERHEQSAHGNMPNVTTITHHSTPLE